MSSADILIDDDEVRITGGSVTVEELLQALSEVEFESTVYFDSDVTVRRGDNDWAWLMLSNYDIMDFNGGDIYLDGHDVMFPDPEMGCRGLIDLVLSLRDRIEALES